MSVASESSPFDETALCPLCLGVGREVDVAVRRIEELLAEQAGGAAVSLRVQTPPVLDVSLRAVRLLLAESPAPPRLPTLAHWLTHSIESRGRARFAASGSTEAAVEVTVQDLSSADVFAVFAPNAQARKRRRFHSGRDVSKARETEDRAVSRTLADAALLAFKSYDERDIADLKERLRAWSQLTSPSSHPLLRVDVRFVRQSVYLLGRYCKFARDVPQSQWSLSAEEDSSCRRGRASVEEIVCEAATSVLRAHTARFHACGREDIDVRMLGDGRAFVLEVSEPSERFQPQHLFDLQTYINSFNGLNDCGDIQVMKLQLTTASTWSSMQAVAEEKRKGYRAVVWCSKSVDESRRSLLRESCLQNVDDSNIRCLEIQQRTPLRVLHRRSLLARKRFIYDIRISQVNSSFFILDLVTSAGTYVKEFVHGKLGRTEPSVSSIVGCQCDILQLDVTRLYDDLFNEDQPDCED